jgi:hypothetical protein
MTVDTQQRKADSLAEKRHAKELKRFQNNVKKRFQNDEANDANQIRTEDLK